MHNKKAFTLAEILIVIGIIGVIATLIVPNLSDDIDESKNITRLKKAFNDIELAYNHAQAKYGMVSMWEGNKTPKYIVDNLKVAKNCTNATDDSCFPVADINESGDYYKAILSDGTALAIKIPTEANIGNNIVEILVGVDGANGDDTLGKSIFSFELSNELGLVPTGYNRDRDGSNNFTGEYTDIDDLTVSNWAMTNNNMDYLKTTGDDKKTCPDGSTVLNWNSNLSCN